MQRESFKVWVEKDGSPNGAALESFVFLARLKWEELRVRIGRAGTITVCRNVFEEDCGCGLVGKILA